MKVTAIRVTAMTVKELRKALRGVSQDLPVVLPNGAVLEGLELDEVYVRSFDREKDTLAVVARFGSV